MIAQLSKRFLSLLLATVMIISMVPVQAFATENSHVRGSAADQHRCGGSMIRSMIALGFF